MFQIVRLMDEQQSINKKIANQIPVIVQTKGKPKGRFFWFTFGICMVRIRYADQKLLCLQWKCGLGLEMALSVDARRGSAPCRWAFPGVLFIIKKCWNEILVILKKNNINHQNHSNNAKKQKNFQMTKHLHRDLSTTNQKNRPFGLYNNRNLIGYLLVNRLLFIH